jgi:hypothetical protein
VAWFLLVRAARADEGEEPRYDLATLEASVILGCGTGWYWLDQKTNRPDWDNPALWSRFDGSAWRLDNNRFGINYVGHPLTGALSYSMARVHRLPPWAAFSFAFGTSLAWELGIEFKEKVSTNDVITTGPAGVPVGEALYKAGAEVVGALGGDVPTASLGRERRIELELGTGVVVTSSAGRGASSSLRHRSSFVWIPGYRRAGTFDRWFTQAEIASLAVDVPVTELGKGFLGEASTVLVGLHSQALEGPDAALEGWSLTVGSPMAFRYEASSALGFRQLLADLRFPGLGISATAARGGVRVEGTTAVNYDLVGMSAPAYADWAGLNPNATGKSILRREGYFYGHGPSLRARMAFGVGAVEWANEASLFVVRSIDGMDRTQETLTVDEHLRSNVLTGATRACAGAGTWRGCLRGEVTHWTSRVDALATTRTAAVFDASASLSF